jgi:SAM-dependent methyltransferase
MTVERFYDDLASDYHLNYHDWREAVPRQGRVLADLLQSVRGPVPPATVLDCTCGIGTQAIGLALAGYSVTGSDISARSVDRARREAAAFGVDAAWDVADVRNLAEAVPGTFDVVISCDNSLPHLLTDADLLQAVSGMFAKLRPGGLVVIGIRDYDRLQAERPRFTPPQVVEHDGERTVLFQLWDWAPDGSTYDLTMFRHRERDGDWTSAIGTTTYRALLRSDLERTLVDASFHDIRWYEPEETGHHQPLVTARRE